MSLRCSLLGHSYGETEIEREREEQGSEVVVTVREFEECERCGDRKIVTENKEVTALQSPAPDLESAESDGMEAQTGATAGSDAGTGPSEATAPDATAGVETGAAADAEVAAAASEDDAEIMTDATESGGASASGPSNAATARDEDAPSASGSEAASSDVEDDFEEPRSAAEDDGIILDDDEDDSTVDGRTPGEWPEAETTHPAETDESPGEWPAVGREDEDEGFDAEPGDPENADVEFGGGLTPESAPEVDDESDDVEFVNAEGDALQAKDAASSTTELSSGISAGAEAPSLSGPADDPDVDAEFVCPECDYRQAVAGSSLRAGDICPECARGYLAQN